MTAPGAAVPRRAASYTESHPVARSFRCEGCGCEMSGDDIGEQLLDAWNANHADCTKDTEP